MLSRFSRSVTVIGLSLLVSSAGYAAQDHNSSRSNKTASIASDTSGDLEEYSREVLEIGDNVDKKLLKKLEAIEVQTRYLRNQMLIDTFVKTMMENARKLGCKSLEDQECMSRAITDAEEVAHSAAGNGDELKVKFVVKK